MQKSVPVVLYYPGATHATVNAFCIEVCKDLKLQIDFMMKSKYQNVSKKVRFIGQTVTKIFIECSTIVKMLVVYTYGCNFLKNGKNHL